MADQVSSKVAELSWALGKFVLKASGAGLLVEAGDAAGKAYKLVRSLIKIAVVTSIMTLLSKLIKF